MMGKIPPPIVYIEAYFQATLAMRALEAIPDAPFLGPSFDDGITNAFNELDDALGNVSWIIEDIEELREQEGSG